MNKNVIEINTMGLACPEPVLRTKEALTRASAGDRIKVLVDNKTAQDNVMRYAQSTGHSARIVSENDKSIYIEITSAGLPTKNDNTVNASSPPVVFIGSDTIGRGDDKLGKILMGAMLGAISETKPSPSALVFMNSGVKLAAEGSEVIDKLKKIEKLGMEILVCGTCLDYFNIKEKIAVGKVSNMYSILETFLKAGNVISA